MIRAHKIDVDGARLVVMREADYETLCRAAGRAADDDGLPAFPKPEKDGTVPAVEYARVSIARDLIRARRETGLSQQELASLAGVRQETLSRIETAKHSASPGTIGKITRALEKAVGSRKRSAAAKRVK